MVEKETAGATVEQSSGVVEKVKEAMNVDTIVEKIKSSKDFIFEIALYTGIGFLSGFLIKKYSTYMAAFVLFLIGLGVLQHFGLVSIMVQWDKVNAMFGMQSVENVSADNVISMVWEWAKLNMVISISYVVGLFLGLKVG